jgi:hypothetical protein
VATLLAAVDRAVSGYRTSDATTMRITHIAPASRYNRVHGRPAPSSRARTSGPTMAPTPKNPSSMFMIDVCSDVDETRSPMSASAPVLKTPIAIPDSPSSTAKNTNELPIVMRKHAAAKSVRPVMIVRRRPIRSASCPSSIAAIAIPPIVAYWKLPAAVSESLNVLITSGMMIPTESVVIANIANIA